MVLERTLHLFRDRERLQREHPTYRMICTPIEALRRRAEALIAALAPIAPGVTAEIGDSIAYLGSGSLPTEAIPSVMVTVQVPRLGASELARRLRLDEGCVFSRIEEDRVRLDMRTITDEQAGLVAAALGRVCRS
jgi:L-seryl-tRNA(Ser) seleniumtransferase